MSGEQKTEDLVPSAYIVCKPRNATSLHPQQVKHIKGTFQNSHLQDTHISKYFSEFCFPISYYHNGHWKALLYMIPDAPHSLEPKHVQYSTLLINRPQEGSGSTFILENREVSRYSPCWKKV